MALVMNHLNEILLGTSHTSHPLQPLLSFSVRKLELHFYESAVFPCFYCFQFLTWSSVFNTADEDRRVGFEGVKRGWMRDYIHTHKTISTREESAIVYFESSSLFPEKINVQIWNIKNKSQVTRKSNSKRKKSTVTITFDYRNLINVILFTSKFD